MVASDLRQLLAHEIGHGFVEIEFVPLDFILHPFRVPRLEELVTGHIPHDLL